MRILFYRGAGFPGSGLVRRLRAGAACSLAGGNPATIDQLLLADLAGLPADLRAHPFVRGVIGEPRAPA